MDYIAVIGAFCIGTCIVFAIGIWQENNQEEKNNENKRFDEYE